MKNNEQEIFSPGFQDLFWKTFDPDLRGMMSGMESKETWTHTYDEFPFLFKELAELVLLCDEQKALSADDKIIRDFISVLSAMPVRQSLSALSWLDSKSTSEDTIGWGAKIFLGCVDIYKNRESDPLKREAKALYMRVQAISSTKILVDLFVNQAFFGGKHEK